MLFFFGWLHVSLLSALFGQQVAAPCVHISRAGPAAQKAGAAHHLREGWGGGRGWGSISPGSPQPRHTTVAPVVVNELCAAPISHAQVVYLRGNELLFQALFLAPACRIAAPCARDYRRVHRVNNELRLHGCSPFTPTDRQNVCVGFFFFPVCVCWYNRRAETSSPRSLAGAQRLKVQTPDLLETGEIFHICSASLLHPRSEYIRGCLLSLGFSIKTTSILVIKKKKGQVFIIFKQAEEKQLLRFLRPQGA